MKHCSRLLLIEFAILLVTSRRCSASPRGAPDAEASSSASGGDAAAVVASSAAASGTRRLASALPLRPEEIAAGYEIAELFFDTPLSVIQRWCPLEEQELMEPFKEETGRWAYEVFGVNACLVGCVLCLTSGIRRQDLKAAMLTEPRVILKPIRDFYKEAGQISGGGRDAVFAPGPRILWQQIRDGS